MIPYLRFEILKNHTLSGDAHLPTLYKGLSPHPPPPQDFTGRQMPGYSQIFYC